MFEHQTLSKFKNTDGTILKEKRKLNKVERLVHGTSLNGSKTAPSSYVFKLSA